MTMHLKQTPPANNTNIVVFSKDRPGQLEACIRTLKMHFKEYEFAKKTAILCSTNEAFKKGYELTRNIHPEFDYMYQTSFRQNVLDSMDDNNSYTMFLVDDILFKDNFSLNDDVFGMLKNNDHMLAVSLRLHPKASYCYALDKNMVLPKFSRHVANKFLVWQYLGADGDWGYGLSVDGNVYNTKYIKWRIDRIDFHNPNSLEANLNSQQHTPGIIPIYMCCYDGISKLFNNPANRVQQQFNNRHENSLSSEAINDLYLSGYKISLENVTGINNFSVHYPVDVIMKK
jgi:hypothetical protein